MHKIQDSPSAESTALSMSTSTLVFHSRSKSEAAKYLSNFQKLENPIEDEGGCFFSSVEAWFQAHKMRASGNETEAREFEVGGKYGDDPKKAKKQGSRSAFQKLGLKLTPQWDSSLKNTVMQSALKKRFDTDARFKGLLCDFAQKGVYLLHFERSGPKSYWGGFLNKKTGEIEGENALGKMMQALLTGQYSEGVSA